MTPPSKTKAYSRRYDKLAPKRCPRCGEVKTAENFWFAPSTGRLVAYCKPCAAAKRAEYRQRNRDWYHANKDRARANMRKYKYGLSGDQYQAMVSAQGGKCALCKRESKKPLSVDHDHSCCPGQGSCGNCIRGLLCNPCNVGLGLLGDNEIGLRRALAYLQGGPQ